MYTGRARSSRVIAGLVLAAMLSLGLAEGASANSYPEWANSHYMSPVSNSYMYDRGCDLGHGDYRSATVTDLAVILDFGYASKSGSDYGAGLWDGGAHTFKSTSWIANRSENFAAGYYDCSGSDPLELILGISTDTSALTTAHASAWAAMVNSINGWLANEGMGWQISADGGIDIESGFDATQSNVTDWVDAYGAASDGAWIYDFGDAAGCPTNAQYTAPLGYQCNRSWSQNKYWYWSYGCDACLAIPEIYNETKVTLPNGETSDPNAQQWEGVRRYGYHEKSSTPYYLGSTTQHTACGQPGHSCSGTDNTRLGGWNHLHNSVGAYTPITTDLRWSTDFMWGW